MILPDVNILVHAHRIDTPHHTKYFNWLENALNSQRAFGICEIVLSGFLRVVTHPRIFKRPSTFTEANIFVDQIRTHDHCVIVSPGERHWDIFVNLCKQTKATGNFIPDAYLAAIVVETGNELITADKGFSRFATLKYRNL